MSDCVRIDRFDDCDDTDLSLEWTDAERATYEAWRKQVAASRNSPEALRRWRRSVQYPRKMDKEEAFRIAKAAGYSQDWLRQFAEWLERVER